MAYSQSKKLTDAEKKLQSLRMQFYGKGEKQSPQPSATPDTSFKTFQFTQPGSKISGVSAAPLENNYLKKDLFKTLVLAIFAITIQLLLYFSLNQGLIKF